MPRHFTTQEYDHRQARAVAALQQSGFDALLPKRRADREGRPGRTPRLGQP